jgi:hypothetical protein
MTGTVPERIRLVSQREPGRRVSSTPSVDLGTTYVRFDIALPNGWLTREDSGYLMCKRVGGWEEMGEDDMVTALELLWMAMSWTISRENLASLVSLIGVMAELVTE